MDSNKSIFLLFLSVLHFSQQHSNDVGTWRTLPKSLDFPIKKHGYINIQTHKNQLNVEVVDANHQQKAVLRNEVGEAKLLYQKEENGIRVVSAERNIDFFIGIEILNNGYLLHIFWTAGNVARKQMCYDLSGAEWNGGPQQKRQFWPIQKLVLPEYSYLPKEADNAAITEPYWLNSNGSFIYVHKEVPLFIDQNNIQENGICLISEVKPPYSSKRKTNELNYVLGYFENARTAHKFVIERFFKKPTGYPDFRMTELPIWSTWAEYKRDINETIVMEFANKIVDNKFKNGQLEVDDLWETCYGSLTVDQKSFPDMKGMIQRVKNMGFRVTFWIHPFIDQGCQPVYNEALQKGYLVKSENGSVSTSWWNSNGPTAAYIDFTNPEAANWWYLRLRTLQDTYEIDSFKFDAGETSWSPQIPILRGALNEQPSFITQDYVKTCARFGSMVEVRSGIRTQELPIYVRMIDKDSEWNFENGLPTLITTLLQMNMNGYVFVLPDMIGGNGYNGKPGKELFIRWLQANTFMPSLQFSYVPWSYDMETVNISRKFTELHERFTPKIIEAFQRAVMTGEPVNPPVWWIDPTNDEAHTIWDEYLLGEEILVAPVITQGAVSRDVYLPEGTWLAQGDSSKVVLGRQWLRGYLAPLDTLPFFVRTN